MWDQDGIVTQLRINKCHHDKKVVSLWIFNCHDRPSSIILGENMLLLARVKSSHKETLKKLS